MEKGDLLAEGRTAEVYAWGDDQILKLYREGFPPGDAEYEYKKALASQETGCAVPKVGELVTMDGRFGITYQRVEGETMIEAVGKSPWKFFTFVRQLANMHVDMHTRSAKNLPTIHERLSRKISEAPHLDEKTKGYVLKHLDNLPRDDKLLHGDFHPDNVMLTPNGPVIIDWIDAAVGHPLADVARTTVIAMAAGPPPGTPGMRFVRLQLELFRRLYLKRYFKVGKYPRKDLDAWMLPVAAGRLEEGIESETEQLVKMVSNLLVNL